MLSSRGTGVVMANSFDQPHSLVHRLRAGGDPVVHLIQLLECGIACFLRGELGDGFPHSFEVARQAAPAVRYDPVLVALELVHHKLRQDKGHLVYLDHCEQCLEER